MKDGILVVNKPKGLSSAAVVARLKRKLGVKKIGHTGTLDPFATGVLLIAVEKATRISRFFLDGAKAYVAQVTLGIETDTYDCTGQEVCRTSAQDLTAIAPGEIQSVADRFHGIQNQTAPAYSALKHQGVPLYKLARQGKAVQKPPRQIEIFKINARNFSVSQEGYPVFDLEVHCSGGTYIRSLAFDIGRILGCGAHLSGLVRIRSSQFRLSQALDLAAMEAMPQEEIQEAILPMSQCLDFLPRLEAGPETAVKISHGKKLVWSEFSLPDPGKIDPNLFYRVEDEEDRLLAVVQPNLPDQGYNYCCVFPR